MGVLQVSRIQEQNLAAVMVSMADADKVATLLAMLMTCGYETESLTGPQHPGGWRIKMVRGDDPPEFAYQGDWILVTDASYSPLTGWALNPETSRACVYGVSSGQLGCASDFIQTFTAETPTRWSAVTTPPEVEVIAEGVRLTFKAPTSANGPHTYTVHMTDGSAGGGEVEATTGEPVVTDGVVSIVVADLIVGHEYTFSVTVSTGYQSVAPAVSAATLSVVAGS